jgi:DNA-binding CsgD family transcriptional regulator/tetratricopeptide (TPR) repeat protein
VVLVDGEAGIGKTRLVAEYLARRPDIGSHALVACCPPLRTPQTLAPVADAARLAAPGGIRNLGLSALAGALRPLFPEWSGHLPPALEPAEDASAARYRLFCAFAELLRRLQISLLVVEDVQWADETTVEFLLYLTSRQATEAQPAGLVVTSRPEDVPARSLLRRLSSRLSPSVARLRLTLGSLDVADTAGLVSSMLSGERVSAGFAAFLHARTEGVPLAVEESVRLMADRGDVFRHDGGWLRRHLPDIIVPLTIRDAVLERAALLGEDAQTLLRVAAVLADPVSEATLGIMAGLPAERTRTGLREALGCGLLAEDDRGLVSFRHALASRAVYEAMPAPDRRALHQWAGSALEGRAPRSAARLARHFREAAVPGKWARYAEQAADLALVSGDEATAGALLHDLVTGAELPARLMTRLAGKIPFTAFTGPDRHRGLVSALRSALNSGKLGPEEEAGVRFELGRALGAAEEWAEARVELERAIPHLGHDPVSAGRAMILLGWPRGTTCPASVHLRWLRRASELVDSAAQADRLRLTVDRVTALLSLGQVVGWAEAATLPDDAFTAQERREIARSHLNIGDAAMKWGHYAEAGRRLAKALDQSSSRGYARIHDQAQATQAHLDWFTGAWEALAERAGSVAGNEDVQPVTRLEGILVSGLLHAAVGPDAQADERLRFVLTETQQCAETEFAMESAAALARLWLVSGRVDDALNVTEAPIGMVEAKGTWVWATEVAPARVQALTAAGRIAEAGELVAAFARGLRGRNAPAPKAALTLCRAILATAGGEHCRAAATFARAATAWKALPRPYDALLALEHQARCLLAAGKRDAAMALMTEILSGLCQLGAARAAGRVRASLRENGVRIRRRGAGRPSYGGQLSPREREVVRLLVDGRTNREIAASLFVSPKTVAYHLDSARRKLHAPSRTALAVSVIDAGIVPGPDRGVPGHQPAGRPE